MKFITAAAGCFAFMMTACNSVDFKKTKGGMPYKLYASKSGKKVEPGNFVKLHINQKIKDSLTFSSYKTMPIYIPVSPNGNTYDFTEILPSLKQGDSLYTVQVMDSFIKRNPQMIPPQYKKGDKIETFLKVVDVFKTQEEYQRDYTREAGTAFDRDSLIQDQLKRDIAGINNYLSANRIIAQKTGRGTYVQVIKPGTGAQVQEEKYVAVNFTGTTFDGKVFDTNTDPKKGPMEPMVFQVGVSNIVRGFDEGVRLLKEGGRAKVFIPSMLAYGAKGEEGVIPPFSNLIFDIEVVQVSDQPIQMKQPQQPAAPRN